MAEDSTSLFCLYLNIGSYDQTIVENMEDFEDQAHNQAQQAPVFDLNNYKGMFYDQDNEKYTCPHTGAHFRFGDLC